MMAICQEFGIEGIPRNSEKELMKVVYFNSKNYLYLYVHNNNNNIKVLFAKNITNN